MIEILAHRANVRGPQPSVENSYAACAEALSLGFGLEIDLRRIGDEFLISHDPAPLSEGNALTRFAELFGRYPELPLAVNVKELGYEADLIRLADSGVFGRASFYFDFELLEPGQPGSSQRKLRSLPGGDKTRLASRISDRNESLEQCLGIPTEVVWADEFDRLWLTEEVIRTLRDAGRRIYVISPELHGFSTEDRLRRWADFKSWGVDGLCTDFSLEALEFFRS